MPHLADWPGPALWSPENPNLYDLRLELLDPDGEVLDRVESYFGMRKIEVKDGKVLLNDRLLYQRLVLDQGYFPEGILTAPRMKTCADVRRPRRWDFTAQTPEGRRPALAVLGRHPGLPRLGRDGERLPVQPRIRAAHDGRVAGGRNARLQPPCIVAWVPMNESWGVLTSRRTGTRRPSTSSPSTT